MSLTKRRPDFEEYDEPERIYQPDDWPDDEYDEWIAERHQETMDSQEEEDVLEQPEAAV